LLENRILQFRRDRNLGAGRIQTELLRLNNDKLSLACIHKVLSGNKVNPMKQLKRKKKYKRSSRPIPGDSIQVDTCKITSGIYQYTAVDDCTRWRVLAICKRRTAKNTLVFIDKMIEEFPFPIQRIQSDRGREFFAHTVQKKHTQQKK
jgi:transposase-like protein